MEAEEETKRVELEPRNLNVRMEPNPVMPEIYLFEDSPSISNIDNTFLSPLNNTM
jgi:hypothetical protein